MESELSKIDQSNSSVPDKISKYEQVAECLMEEPDAEKIVSYMTHSATKTHPIVADKAFRAIVYHIMQNLDDDGAIALTNKALELMSKRSMSFLHTLHAVRMMLRDVYEELEKYDDAARVMEKLSSSSMKDTFKMEYPKYADDDIAYWKWFAEYYLKIAKYWISWDKFSAASFYIRKVISVLYRLRNAEEESKRLQQEQDEDEQKKKKNGDMEGEYPFKSTIFLRKLCLFNSASVFDLQREFARAATQYYELFQLSCNVSDKTSSTQQQNNSFLQSAMKCAILTDPSQATRSRMLGTLYKDERTHAMPQFVMLEKMYMERILRRVEVSSFEETLSTHQKVTGMDGLTSIMRSVIMHNILAASKIYRNVRISELAEILEIDQEQAENNAAKLIAEGRLVASIDQISGFLEFEGTSTDTREVYNKQISELCTQMNVLVTGGMSKKKT